MHPLRRLLFGNADPYYRDFVPHVTDLQGWGGDRPILPDLWERAGGDGLAVEIGVWKGQSAIHVARRMRERGRGHLLAVDTFLGSVEHWAPPWDNRDFQLFFKHGRPDLYERFLTNILAEGLEEWITPLPLPSDVAAEVLHRKKAGPFDYVYIDASHDYASVQADIARWSGLVRPGGILAGDDHDANWPEVKRAVDESVPGVQSDERTWWKVMP